MLDVSAVSSLSHEKFVINKQNIYGRKDLVAVNRERRHFFIRPRPSTIIAHYITTPSTVVFIILTTPSLEVPLHTPRAWNTTL
jgi:hypothetical protein